MDSFPNPNRLFRERPQTQINMALLPSHRSPDGTHSRLPQEADLLKGTRCPASNKSHNQHPAGDVPACVASLRAEAAHPWCRSTSKIATKDSFQTKYFSENVPVWETSILQLGNSV